MDISSSRASSLSCATFFVRYGCLGEHLQAQMIEDEMYIRSKHTDVMLRSGLRDFFCAFSWRWDLLRPFLGSAGNQGIVSLSFTPRSGLPLPPSAFSTVDFW